MPHYDFEDVATGEAVELFFSMSDAPRVGEVVRRDGRRLRRVWSVNNPVLARREVSFKAWSLDPWTPGFDRYDTDGQPLVSGKRELRRGLDGARRAGVDLAYGDGGTAVD